MIKNYFSKKKSKWKAILLTLTILGTLFGIIMYVVISAGFTSYAILTQNKNNKIRTKKTRTYYTVNKYADEEPEIEGTTSATNGTGLNLMLINNIKTEGFVKEYLTLASQNSEGKLNTYPDHVSVEMILAANATESGFYDPAGALPKQYLPWCNICNGPAWKCSHKGVDKNQLTLSQANRNVFTASYTTTYGTVPTSFSTTSGGSDLSTGPFQINGLNSNGGYAPSVMNGYKEGNGRSFDCLYFPDNLSALDSRMTHFMNGYSYDTWDDKMKTLVYSLYYNPGSGDTARYALGGNGISTEKAYNILNNTYLEDLKYVNEKYGAQIGALTDYNQYSYAIVSLTLVRDRGWKISSLKSSYANSLGKKYWSSVLGESGDLSSFVSKNIGDAVSASSYSRTTFTIYKDLSDGTRISIDNIGIGHAYCYLYAGQYIYAKMLKYAGVNVDPANPETYMNKYQGEWMPSGDLFWLKEAVPSIDINSVPKKVGEFLNFAKQFLGTPYVWGGRKPGGFDCSGYIQYCVQTHFGGTFGWTTVDQPGDPRVYEVSSDERRIGDFIYIGGAYASASHHVVIYLADAEPGFIWAMHAPQTGDVVKIGRYPTKEPFYYRRLKDYGS